VTDRDSSGLLVYLGASRYLVPLSAVAEVGRPPGLTRLPGVPAWVAGVGNWRGRVLAVLDLRPLLGGARRLASPGGGEGRLVVLREGAASAGLLTDGVGGVRPLHASELEPALSTLPAEAARLLAGQLPGASGPTGVLDPTEVFALRARLPAARRNDAGRTMAGARAPGV